MSFPKFDHVPNHYAGGIIQAVKEFRLVHGKRSLTPTRLEIGRLQILIPRYFGFCFGVERAIHMAFSGIEKNPGRPLYLVSQIIHNPLVNLDLQARGVHFLFDAQGKRQILESQITAGDLVLIPAFGTTLEIEGSLQRSGIDTASERFRDTYDTTCPFVSKVWDCGEQLGREGYTIIIHGKFNHEETRATQSHIARYARTMVVLDRDEATQVSNFITGKIGLEEFGAGFAEKWAAGFDPEVDLERLAVVNQTTMLAEETQEVTRILQDAMRTRYGEEKLDYHFANTSDTLCYATHWNQNATKALLSARPDLAVIVGGYNSSNTSHLVEICSQVVPSYLIESSTELLSPQQIRHFDLRSKAQAVTQNWLPASLPVRIAVTSGASCPDVLMNQVIEKIAAFCGDHPDQVEVGLEGLSLFN